MGLIKDDLMRRMPHGGTLLDALWASIVEMKWKMRGWVEAKELDKEANDWLELRRKKVRGEG